MKKAINISISIIAVLFFISVIAYAGDYHNSPIICSDCHVMHASINGSAINGGAGYSNLLKSQSTNELCLDCHSENGGAAPAAAPKVADYSGDSSPGKLYAAGGFGLGPGENVWADISGSADYRTGYGHDLEVSAPAPGSYDPPGYSNNWRSGSDTALNCASCHDQHGDSLYRNLKTNPNTNNDAEINYVNVQAFEIGYFDTEVWYGTGTYTRAGVAGANAEDITSFCQDCHEKFGPANGYTNANLNNEGPYDAQGVEDEVAPFSHHPMDLPLTATENTNYGNASGGDTYPLLETTGGNDAVFCLTCHRAHGSQYSDGLRFDSGTATYNGGPEACQVCHNK